MAIALLGGLSWVASSLATESRDAPRFERDVLPIFEAHCLKCHGGRVRKQGLDLSSPEGILRGGQNGPVLVKGRPEASVLYEQLAEKAMPPGREKLSESELATIRLWIAEGSFAGGLEGPRPRDQETSVAPTERAFWAFRTLRRPPIPRISGSGRARTPIDAFVLESLESRGLSFSADASPGELIRRATFDLIGLPPSPEDVDDFLADPSPGAYERLIDRLLASPQYGERWARHWLDAVGYVDTVGTDNDAATIRLRDGAWKYRDYVVRSFNADAPQDRFLVEQVAGDELVDWRGAEAYTPEVLDPLIATGFLRTACDNTTEDELNRPLERYQVLHGTIENVTGSLLGLTVACAHCHDHKFDPIPQRDYYRLMALFTPSYNPSAWIQPQDRYLPDVSPAQKTKIERWNAGLDRQIAERKALRAALRRPYESKLVESRLAALPATLQSAVRNALATPAEKRTREQAGVVAGQAASLKVSSEEVTRALDPRDQARQDEIDAELATIEGRRRTFGKIQAIFECGPPPKTYQLRRGEHERPGPEVAPGFLEVLGGSSSIEDAGPAAAGGSSGRRTAFARWLTAPGTPASALVARVLVNRVWQHHFGTGVVATPENFGRMGAPPSHPELLEWLASDLVTGGWRLKPLHKRIMTSTVYLQSSGGAGARPDNPSVHDPDNVLLWRKPLRRLEAEAIRDAVLAVSGRLDTKLGGPPIPIESRPDGSVVVAETGLPSPSAARRRSLYLLSRRNYGLSILETFDAPIMTGHCPRRVESIVPLQALSLMNGTFIREEAAAFAERLERLCPGSPRGQVEHAFRLALSRPPTPAEATWSLDLVREQVRSGLRDDPRRDARLVDREALSNLALMLFNSNEFLFLE